MKRIFIGTAVVAMALLSACETLEIQESLPQDMTSAGVSGGAHQVLFTATLGNDTKTYLEYDAEKNVYKTLWSENDVIQVLDPATGIWEECRLLEGAGTQTATFVGSLEADSYIAVYSTGADMTADGELTVYMSNWQSNNQHWYWDEVTQTEKMETRLPNNAFPMVAQSDTKTFSFKNLCSLLKVSVTGNGEELRYIYVRTNDKNISLTGTATIDMSGDEPALKFDDGYDYIEFSYWGVLDDTPSERYIVLPAQTYTGGLTLEFVTDRGTMDVTVTDDIEMRRSRIRKIEVAYETEEWSEPSDTWGICGEMTGWTDDIPMEYEDGYFVARNVQLEAWQNFVFRSNGDWDGARYALSQEYYYYFGNNAPTNTNISVVNGEWQSYYNMAVLVSGTYDLYLDVYKEEAFIMSAGVALDDIPTTSYVQGWNYDNLNSKVDGTLVKVEGYVMAKTNLGFILALDGKYQNSIYVYDKNNLLEHIELGNYVDVYAKKITYRGLAELEYSSDAGCWSYVLDPTVVDYSAEYAVDITDYISSYSPDRYQYVRVMGTLTKSGNYYNLVVDGATVIGSIISPVQDLTEYLDKTVCVEGYFCGLQTSGGVTYSNIALKRISGVDTEGSTPDVGVGGDIIVSSPLRMKSNR